MCLSEDEQTMLEGRHSSGVRKATELLVEVGNAYNAERMIDVSHAHVIAFPELYGLISELTKNATAKIPTSANPLFLNLRRAKEMGLPESVLKEAQRTVSLCCPGDKRQR